MTTKIGYSASTEDTRIDVHGGKILLIKEKKRRKWAYSGYNRECYEFIGKKIVYRFLAAL